MIGSNWCVSGKPGAQSKDPYGYFLISSQASLNYIFPGSNLPGVVFKIV